jgi:hypothetical protein
MTGTPRKDPINQTTDEVRAEVRTLIDAARFGALSFLDPATGHPAASRIGVATLTDGTPLTLISNLAAHTAALKADPRCALLVGEPLSKGDPLVHPRVSLTCRAEPIAGEAGLAEARARYLAHHPKAGLYAGFADFGFWRLTPEGALFNGGFGRAYRLARGDLVRR